MTNAVVPEPGMVAGLSLLALPLAHRRSRRAWSVGFSVGMLLAASVGIAVEHSTAVLCALRDDMDAAMTIAFQSSLQIALFVVPFLVLLSVGMVALGVG